MSDGERLLDLLADWEQHRQEGKTLSPEELCPDDPTLRQELRRRISRRQQLHELLEPAEPPEAAAGPPEVPGYELLGVLGCGGMGVVYRARDGRLGREVALKLVAGEHAAGAQERARFRAEAQAVAALQHPNIVGVYEAGEAGGRPFLALELVPG